MQTSNPTLSSLIQLLLDTKQLECWVGNKDNAMILQEIGLEVIYHLIDCIHLFINGRVVKFGSLQAFTYKRYWFLFVLIIFLHKYNDERSIISEGVEHKILVEIWVVLG